MKRNRAIDITKGLGILMITYGHITELGNPVDTWMSLFKITVFYFLIGYLAYEKNTIENRTVSDSIKYLFRSLMIPYFSFSIVFIAVRSCYAYLKGQNVWNNVLKNVWATVSLRGISTIWFLPALMMSEILFILIIKSKNKAFIISTYFWTLIFGLCAEHFLTFLEKQLSERLYLMASYPLIFIAHGVVAVWFIMAGYHLCPLLERIRNKGTGLSIGILLSAATIMIALFTKPGIDYNMMRFGKPFIWFFIGGVSGSTGALLVFERIQDAPFLKPVEYFGKNSLVLMAVQRCFLLINFMLNGWKGTIGIADHVSVRYYGETLCILILVLMSSYSFIEIINKYRPLRMAFLGKQ